MLPSVKAAVVLEALAASAERRVPIPVDRLYGPMWYRLLNRHAPLDARLAEQLARTVVTVARGPDID